jgi:putative aldouronate transport system permease protein
VDRTVGRIHHHDPPQRIVTDVTGQLRRPTRRSGRVRRIRDTRSDRGFNAVSLVVLAVCALSVLYPLVYVASSSVSDPEAIGVGAVRLRPIGFSLDAYRSLLENPAIQRGLANSIGYAFGVMTLGTAIVLAAGYALSRRDLVGRRVFTIYFLITLLFSGGIIPTYLVVRQLGLLDTAWAMILPSCMSVWQLIVTRIYFEVVIPHELLECSQLDGATDFGFFFRIALPLARPIIAVNALLFAVSSWNTYFTAMVYLDDPRLFPLQLVMKTALLGGAPGSQTKFALIIIACLPPLLIFPLVQSQFAKGLTLGSVKG